MSPWEIRTSLTNEGHLCIEGLVGACFVCVHCLFCCLFCPLTLHSIVPFCSDFHLRYQALQNLFIHIRKLPHFDTRFGVAQACFMSLQKRAFCLCAGRSVVSFWVTSHHCSEGQFLGLKRVSKWGNFIISLKFFCKRCAGFSYRH